MFLYFYLIGSYLEVRGEITQEIPGSPAKLLRLQVHLKSAIVPLHWSMNKLWSQAYTLHEAS